MSTHATATAKPAAAHAAPQTNYLTNGYGWKSWLLTVDHKRIAILYLLGVSFFFTVGGLFATMMRIELATPRGDLVDAETYNRLFTMHGIVMIFFFLIPSIPAVLGNFLLPIMIGARDLAFPKINLLSWYIYMVGGILGLTVAVLGGVDTGWTFYTPYSSTFSNSQVALTAIAAFITGFSSILTGLNFLVTVHKMRAPGMTWFRLPLFVWAHYATSLIMVLATPVLATTLFLLALERIFRIGIYDPTLGGDPVLFQHMFWFYSHPAVYIMVLPGMGVISEVIACFSKKRVFGYSFVAFSSLAIAVLGFLVWGHHMYTTGQSAYASIVFSVLTMLVAVPSAVKVFNWTATLYKGTVEFTTPMYFAMGFIGLFVIGGLTGVFLGIMAVDRHLHDTYFVVAHFHYVMVGSTVTAFMAGIHFWWPKMFGRMYSEFLGRMSAIIVFVGFNLTFLPQFIVGYQGMPRRYHVYSQEFGVYNLLSSAGASIMGVGYLLPACYLLWSLKWGPKAGDNPWGAKGLEWEIESPPTTHNFHGPVRVAAEAYPYAEENPHVPELPTARPKETTLVH